MKKIMISVVGWSSVLFILLGAYLFVGISARDISVARVGAAILLFALGICANLVANRSGWNHPKELYAVFQFLGRLKARIGNSFPLRAAQEGQSEKKRAFRFVRPPIQLRIYLYTTSLICLIVAILLEMPEYVRGVPMFGHSMFDTVAYIFVSLAIIVLVINILVILGFFLKSVISFLRGR
jgi:hypothetical protein